MKYQEGISFISKLGRFEDLRDEMSEASVKRVSVITHKPMNSISLIFNVLVKKLQNLFTPGFANGEVFKYELMTN